MNTVSTVYLFDRPQLLQALQAHTDALAAQQGESAARHAEQAVLAFLDSAAATTHRLKLAVPNPPACKTGGGVIQK